MLFSDIPMCTVACTSTLKHHSQAHTIMMTMMIITITAISSLVEEGPYQGMGRAVFGDMPFGGFRGDCSAL